MSEGYRARETRKRGDAELVKFDRFLSCSPSPFHDRSLIVPCPRDEIALRTHRRYRVPVFQKILDPVLLKLMFLLIDKDGSNNNGADDDLLDIVGHAEHVAPVAQHRHD